MKKVYSLFCVVLLSPFCHAQLLTWSPAFAKDNDNITITVDATKGNQALMNFSGNVYVHVGVITSASTSGSDWQHVPFTWGSTTPAAQASAAGTNKWSFTINNVRTFFNVPAAETIKKIAILFRDGAGNTVQRNSDGSDMYIPIYDNNIAVRFSAPPFEPRYVPVPEPINIQAGNSINVTGIANQVADMKLYLNGSVIQTATGVTTISANPTVATSGNNEIVVQGTAAALTKKDTLRIFVSPSINIAPLPNGTRNGINYAANNTDVTLVLYAREKRESRLSASLVAATGPSSLNT
jgi:hypothetical protein